MYQLNEMADCLASSASEIPLNKHPLPQVSAHARQQTENN